MVLSKNNITEPTRLRLKIRACVVVLPFYDKIKNNFEKKNLFFSFERLIGVARLENAGGDREWAITHLRRHRHSRFFFLSPVLSTKGNKKNNCFLLSFHFNHELAAYYKTSLSYSGVRYVRLPYAEFQNDCRRS